MVFWLWMEMQVIPHICLSIYVFGCLGSSCIYKGERTQMNMHTQEYVHEYVHRCCGTQPPLYPHCLNACICMQVLHVRMCSANAPACLEANHVHGRKFVQGPSWVSLLKHRYLNLKGWCRSLPYTVHISIIMAWCLRAEQEKGW
jgi:hypothetical protein